MPWKFNVRHKAERDPQIRDLWAILRHIQQHIGSIPAMLANIALTQSQQGARLEVLEGHVRAMRGQLVDEDQDQEVTP
jgi:hypothetical protein